MHQQLLDQARLLATHDARRPKQANLRRAVSAAYYAMFHFLTAEAAERFIPHRHAPLRHLLARGFQHGEMKSAAKAFCREPLPDAIRDALSGPLPDQLKEFAGTFIEAQENRHCADYDLREHFDRYQVEAFITKVKDAIDSWKAIRQCDAAALFLICLLTWSRVSRR